MLCSAFNRPAMLCLGIHPLKKAVILLYSIVIFLNKNLLIVLFKRYVTLWYTNSSELIKSKAIMSHVDHYHNKYCKLFLPQVSDWCSCPGKKLINKRCKTHPLNGDIINTLSNLRKKEAHKNRMQWVSSRTWGVIFWMSEQVKITYIVHTSWCNANFFLKKILRFTTVVTSVSHQHGSTAVWTLATVLLFAE